MIKAVVFDYGGVITINKGNLFNEIVTYLKISKQEWEKEYFSTNYLFNTNRKSFKEVILSVVFKFTDSEKSKNYILKLMEENYNQSKLNFELIKIIKFLKSENYKIGLLSNNSLEIRQRLIDDKISNLFDSIVISAEVGFQKPEPEIFEISFLELKIKPNEAVFVDDTSRSLEGANKIGYIPILFKNNKTFKKELSNLLEMKIK